MCTLVILRRPDTAWPVLIGANRDEMLDRPWSPPGHHWPDRPDVVAGRDNLAGGAVLAITPPRGRPAAPRPGRERGQWESWGTLLASREQEPDAGPPGALTIVTGENDRRSGYGTSSSSLIAIAAPGHAAPPGIVWRFAPGAPDVTPFQ